MKETSKWWWIKSHNTSNSSPWLTSTLSDLDSKTKEILEVIDEVDNEADSLVKRAKIYYEKKPKLVALVEDLYRSHRSLAHKYDLLVKTSSLNPSRHNSSTCDELWELCEEKAVSEVDDGEEEDRVVEVVGDNGETETNMKEELEILREEKRVYKEMMEREKAMTRLFSDSIRICFRVFLLFPFQLGFVLFSPFAFLFTIFLGLY